MSQPEITSQDTTRAAEAPPAPQGRGPIHHEHVRTDSEVRVDDELGSGDDRR